MEAFTADSAYDPAVNRVPAISTISYAGPTVQEFSLPVVSPMPDAGGTVRDNSFFTAGAKIDRPLTVRSGGDAYVTPSVHRMVRR
jgi:hypothetical protein